MMVEGTPTSFDTFEDQYVAIGTSQGNLFNGLLTSEGNTHLFDIRMKKLLKTIECSSEPVCSVHFKRDVIPGIKFNPKMMDSRTYTRISKASMGRTTGRPVMDLFSPVGHGSVSVSSGEFSRITHWLDSAKEVAGKLDFAKTLKVNML
jgi:hypothetical protein